MYILLVGEWCYDKQDRVPEPIEQAADVADPVEEAIRLPVPEDDILAHVHLDAAKLVHA